MTNDGIRIGIRMIRDGIHMIRDCMRMIRDGIRMIRSVMCIGIRMIRDLDRQREGAGRAPEATNKGEKTRTT